MSLPYSVILVFQRVCVCFKIIDFKDRGTQRQILCVLISSLNDCNRWEWARPTQETRNSFLVSLEHTGAKAVGLFAAAFQGTSAGRRIQSEASGTWTSTNIKYWLFRWWLNLIWQNTLPQVEVLGNSFSWWEMVRLPVHPGLLRLAEGRAQLVSQSSCGYREGVPCFVITVSMAKTVHFFPVNTVISYCNVFYF